MGTLLDPEPEYERVEIPSERIASIMLQETHENAGFDACLDSEITGSVRIPFSEFLDLSDGWNWNWEVDNDNQDWRWPTNVDHDK